MGVREAGNLGMPVTPALGRWRQGDRTFKIIPAYTVSLRAVRASGDLEVLQQGKTDWRLILSMKINANGGHQI